MNLELELDVLLGEAGPFQARIDGFTPRRQQREMASAVHDALAAYEVLICEAGTGTGKTLAYLCPVLLSGGKTIISTATKNLQEQLFRRDLPTVRDALRLPVQATLLKGRANYLCLYRMRQSEDLLSRDPVEQAEIGAIRDWAGGTRTGDIAECTVIAEHSPVWARVTSTVDNCLGQKCEFYSRCYVLKARRAAIEADVVIVNHHLFLADMALREEGFGELLPGAHAVVFDEAHRLPELATRFFGMSLSAAQLRDLARDSMAAFLGEASDMPVIAEAVHAIERAAGTLRDAFGDDRPRLAWNEICGEPEVRRAVEGVNAAVGELESILGSVAERGNALESCARRAGMLASKLESLGGSASEESVEWVELQGRGFSWHVSPLDVAEAFATRMRNQRCAWIFTSATLAINQSVEHFSRRLGLEDYASHVWESPYDFATQALCYLPEALPDPAAPDYSERVVEVARSVLAISRGRAFLLFTSHVALERAARSLAASLEFPLLVQGSAPRDELLRRFRGTEGAVLLGTSSFWEGVDVRGDALCCVLIDKLPFAAPDDPLLQARAAALRKQGQDPFTSYQLPQAVLALKQGAGRLIRDEDDYGVLVLCDPRLRSRSYGRVFMRSLPPMPTTSALGDVMRFFEEKETRRAAEGPAHPGSHLR